MIQEFIKIFDRDLGKLKLEIESFQEEENLWKIEGNIKNTAGNLCLHLVGNLKTYIGKNLGKIDYVRDREAEFNLKNIPRELLLAKVESARKTVIEGLGKLTEEDLVKIYPEKVLGYEMTTNFFLVHLSAHLSYHLGQINYLRRILE